MNTIYVVILLVYLAISLVTAFAVGRSKTKTASDFAVGGRSFGLFVLFFTLLATMIGASAVMTSSYKFYSNGLPQMWFAFGDILVYLIFILYMNKRINSFGAEYGGETVGDWMRFRYGKVVAYISSILIALAYIAITAYQYIAMATIFNLVTGWGFSLCMVITVVIIVVYTSFGGLWSVASTDVIQGAMTLIGCIIIVPIFINKAGGWDSMISRVPAASLNLVGGLEGGGLTTAIASMLVMALGVISWPDIWQRCYAAKDQKTLNKTMWLFVGASLVLSVITILIGFAANSLVKEGVEYTSSTMLPMLVMENTPAWLGAIILAALIAVIMGTADSTLLVSAVIVDKDLIRPFIKKEMTDRESLRFSRIVTAVTGIAVLVVLFFSTDIFEIWVMSADITGATLAVPILLGFCWKRPSGKAALAAIILGFAGWIASYAGLVNMDAIILGALLSLAAYVVVALFIDKPDETRKLY